MNTFEIEIKVLLGDEQKAQELITKLKHHDPQTILLHENSQLNHYFLIQGDLAQLGESLKTYIHADHRDKLHDVIVNGKNHSLRTREVDGKLLLVIKAAVDDTTSSNGTARVEFEQEISGTTLQQLDDIILSHGFPYQSKWSRQRQEYRYKGYNVCIDKNAGYGYVAEFEKILDDQSLAESTKDAIRKELELLGITELPQDRLERMFVYYNQHRPEYYGTEKTFVIE